MVEPYAHIIIKLLQGVIYSDDTKIWNELLVFKSQVTEYFGRMGVDCIIQEADGYSYLVQPKPDESDENKLPRLVKSQPLSYEVTLIAVVLRGWLEEFDNRLDTYRPFILHREIKERAAMFFEDNTNKTKLLKTIDKSIASLVELKILKINREEDIKDNTQYEVKRILKAIINNDFLEKVFTKIKNDAEPI